MGPALQQPEARRTAGRRLVSGGEEPGESKSDRKGKERLHFGRHRVPQEPGRSMIFSEPVSAFRDHALMLPEPDASQSTAAAATTSLINR
jgi:hypothetical protein